jgi:hypothetical protein
MLANFTFQLIAGISLMWVVMPRRQVTSGFFRIQMLLVMGLSVLAALTSTSLPLLFATVSFSVPAGVMAGLAFVGSVFWTLERRVPGGVCAFLIAGLAHVTMGLAHQGVLTPNWLGQLSTGATAAVMGGAVTGMLLGHWYLTAPTMSIAPLSRLNLHFGIALGMRLVISGLAMVLGGSSISGSLLWTWWLLRWLAGILAPLVLCGMTWRILRYRNTQAATGVLFAAVILVFIGELAGLLLSHELGKPY